MWVTLSVLVCLLCWLFLVWACFCQHQCVSVRVSTIVQTSVLWVGACVSRRLWFFSCVCLCVSVSVDVCL